MASTLNVFDSFAHRLCERVRERVPPATLRFADTLAVLAVARTLHEARRLEPLAERRFDASGAAAAIRMSELDDIDLASCTTPSALVVPAVLDAALRTGATPAAVARGLFAGYAATARAAFAAGGIDALADGRWPTLAIAPVGAAAAWAATAGASPEVLARAMRLGALRAIDRVGATLPPLPSRWWLFGESVAAGIAAARAALVGLTVDGTVDARFAVAREAFEQPVDHALDRVSQKSFPCARQGMNAVLALRSLLDEEHITPDRIEHVEVEVPPPCARLIAAPLDPANRLSTIANAGFQLAAAALEPAVLADPHRSGPFDAHLLAFATRVRVVASPTLGASFPRHWSARVAVLLDDGRQRERTLSTAPGDPESPLTRDDLGKKFASLAPEVIDDACEALADPAALARVLARVTAA